MDKNPIQITRNRRREIEPADIADTVELSGEEGRVLASLAAVLEYPDRRWDERFAEAKKECLGNDRPSSAHYAEFCAEIEGTSLLELQELYTKTFDLSPVCALEIGYHLFGEDYKRGAFLARLSETESEYKLGQEHQLPDYLPVVLRLISRMEDAELRAGLIGYCLIPALGMMSDCLVKKPNPYRHLIRFAAETLEEVARMSLAAAEEAEIARCQYV